jgi:hypothetical protein
MNGKFSISICISLASMRPSLFQCPFEIFEFVVTGIFGKSSISTCMSLSSLEILEVVLAGIVCKFLFSFRMTLGSVRPSQWLDPSARFESVYAGIA